MYGYVGWVCWVCMDRWMGILDGTTLGFPHSCGAGPSLRRLSLSRPDGASVGLLPVVLHLIRGRKRPSLYFYITSRAVI